MPVSEIPEIPVELNDEGLSTGVEREQRVEGHIIEPFDPAKIDVVTRNMTVDLLLSRLERDVLDLAPDFQRLAGIWSAKNQSRLIESLLLRIPLPTMYAAERGEDSWVVVDGIQRLTTIARFVNPGLIDAQQLRLSDLEYLSEYEGHTYADLPGRLQTRLRETELVVHLIRSGTPEPVMFNIFARINTGGRILTPQELRHALIAGEARKLLRRAAESNAFLLATQGSVRPDRMADREMALRFMAFRLTEPNAYQRGDLDDFLRKAMKDLNELDQAKTDQLISDFEGAMKSAHDIFGKHAFRKQFEGGDRRLPINKALFEAISVNLAKLPRKHREMLLERKPEVQHGLIDLIKDSSFEQAISVGTGDVEKVRRRFAMIHQLFEDVSR